MDKPLTSDSSSISVSSSSSSSSTVTTNTEMFLKHVNKNSHKIAKPTRKPPLLPPSIPHPDPNPLIPGQAQPPVYNINKNDFRDVVQKLTGSPAHDRLPTPPPPAVIIHHPRPSSSRLQRIRPPPLAQIGSRPPQVVRAVPHPQLDAGQRFSAPQAQPLQPLPPLPSVHPAAESPISAYMRFLQSSATSPSPPLMWNTVAPIGNRPPQTELGPRTQLTQPPAPAPAVDSPTSAYMRFLHNNAYPSPRGNGTAPPPPLTAAQQQQPPFTFPALPLSPVPFGCIPSPRSPYGMMSPKFLFSPTGQFGLPLSPSALLVPSPRWKGI